MAKYEWKMYQIKVRLIMLSCTEISFIIFFFQFWEIWSQTRVSFYTTQSSYLLKTLKKVILTCFTKIIAEQSSVI